MSGPLSSARWGLLAAPYLGSRNSKRVMKSLALGTSVYMPNPAYCQQGSQCLVDAHVEGPEPDVNVTDHFLS